jgi:peptidoglycan L-alanyl-D-glutamate endopeptidase CwlK
MECHPDLIKLFSEVIKITDCSVLCGHRNKKDQDEAERHGFSKLKWPNSKHNKIPSTAIDVVPYPVDWDDKSNFLKFAEVVQKTADQLNINIKWGGAWKMQDMPHWELVD